MIRVGQGVLRAQGGVCPDLAILYIPLPGERAGRCSEATLWPAEWSSGQYMKSQVVAERRISHRHVQFSAPEVSLLRHLRAGTRANVPGAGG